MKNETVEIGKLEGKVGLTAATLPWWARVLIAQHAEAAFSAINPYHLHHCSDCGCVLISTNIAYQYFSNRCPECSKNNRSFQGGN
jgi:Zn finger protein HypA/HybF involved in hydrogenase expression